MAIVALLLTVGPAVPSARSFTCGDTWGRDFLGNYTLEHRNCGRDVIYRRADLRLTVDGPCRRITPGRSATLASRVTTANAGLPSIACAPVAPVPAGTP